MKYSVVMKHRCKKEEEGEISILLISLYPRHIQGKRKGERERGGESPLSRSSKNLTGSIRLLFPLK